MPKCYLKGSMDLFQAVACFSAFKQDFTAMSLKKVSRV
jgi:hypothetical protein